MSAIAWWVVKRSLSKVVVLSVILAIVSTVAGMTRYYLSHRDNKIHRHRPEEYYKEYAYTIAWVFAAVAIASMGVRIAVEIYEGNFNLSAAILVTEIAAWVVYPLMKWVAYKFTVLGANIAYDFLTEVAKAIRRHEASR